MLRHIAQYLIAIAAVGFLAACSEIERPKVEPFYAETVPPPVQELRWSNGKLPKSFDPARAAAAPETDVVRAMHEGLTDLDSETLNEIPALAEKWESSPDKRTWTFRLRKNARWSNGERITARDFVRSWKRLASLGDKAANRFLFQNIVGLNDADSREDDRTNAPADFLPPSPAPEATPTASPTYGISTEPPVFEDTPPPPQVKPTKTNFGVTATDDFTLRVSLAEPDKDFAKLVANSVFRPIHGSGVNFDTARLDENIVTSGPFRPTLIGDDGIILERSATYWNAAAVKLERVQMVPAKSSEAALDAYRRGEIDLLTNAHFEPLALKLLTPYDDFRRTAHNALNFYEINTQRPPFNDRRVREALAISIDRGKLTEGDLEGTMRPAYSLSPDSDATRLIFDVVKARDLLVKAGFPAGAGLPRIGLVINRNDAQQRVARSVAAMWKQALGVETDIIIKESAEIDAVRASGDFDIIRRGIVLPANDEFVNLTAILGPAETTADKPKTETAAEPSRSGPSVDTESEPLAQSPEPENSLSHEAAIYDLRVVPLYFPISYSLVKPYVTGYEINGIDAVRLAEIGIDSEWKRR